MSCENYLIIGDDSLVREKESSRVIGLYSKGGDTDLNFTSHTPDDVEGSIGSLCTMTFSLGKRVVHVKNAEEITEQALGSIIKYLESPSENSVLVMTATGALKKCKGFKKLKGLITVIPADKPKPVKMKGWIRNYFKNTKTRIMDDAIELIVEMKGDDSAGIRTELQKLQDYANGEDITVQSVREVVGKSVSEEVFGLVEALNRPDPEWAFTILRDLYEQKRQPHEVLGYLSWHMRAVQKIKLFLEKGLTLEAIAGDMGYSPYFVKRLASQARKYSNRNIECWLSSLYQTDKDIKTGRQPAEIAMDMLIASLLDVE